MKRLILLSGTPILARPVELYTSLQMLRPDIFNNFYNYTHRYCDPVEGKYGMDYTGADHTKELHYLLMDKIMIRRLKKHVLSELPPKLRQKVIVTTNPKVLRDITMILDRDFKDKKTREKIEDEAEKRN